MNRICDNSVDFFVRSLQRKAPEYLDLLTAETDAEFEEAFQPLLDRAITSLETNKKNFTSLNEEGLTAVIATALTIPGLTATQETNSNGHVDLTIICEVGTHRRRKLGEAKIWRGTRYHIGGIGQLLTRYTTGRESRGIVITYVRQKNIKGLIESLRKTMDDELPLEQDTPTLEGVRKWSFLSTHRHSCGESLQIEHVGCNLFYEQGEV